MTDRADQAEEELERAMEDGIGAIRRRLRRPGADRCVDCGAAIPRDRRRALPSAERCLACERAVELRSA